MSWEVLVTVFTFGGIGAVVRGAVIFILALPSVFFFPFAVLLVNILAAFLGGFIIAITLPSDINSALSIGMVGGLGTLAAFTGDIINHFFDRRHRNKSIALAIIYFVATSISGVLSAQGGMSIGQMVLDYNNTARSEATEQIVKGTEELQQSILESNHLHDADEFLKNKDINIDEYISHARQMGIDTKLAEEKAASNSATHAAGNGADKLDSNSADKAAGKGSAESKVTDNETSAK